MITVQITNERGEVETTSVHDDYLVIAHGSRYVDHEQHYSNGTSVLTIKSRPTKMAREYTELPSDHPCAICQHGKLDHRDRQEGAIPGVCANIGCSCPYYSPVKS